MSTDSGTYVDSESSSLLQEAVALTKARQYERALELYVRVLEMNPLSKHAWNGKGWSLALLQRAEEALPAFEEALLIDGEFREAWSGRGFSFRLTKRWDEAVSAYEKAVNIDPQFAHGWNGLGYTHRLREDYVSSVEAYRRAVEIDSEFRDAWFNLGFSLRRLELHDEALAAFQRSSEIDPRFKEAWFNIGLTFVSLGRNEEALDAYERSLEIDPNYEYAKTSQAAVLRRIEASRGKLGKGEDCRHISEEKFPSSSSSSSSLTASSSSNPMSTVDPSSSLPSGLCRKLFRSMEIIEEIHRGKQNLVLRVRNTLSKCEFALKLFSNANLRDREASCLDAFPPNPYVVSKTSSFDLSSEECLILGVDEQFCWGLLLEMAEISLEEELVNFVFLQDREPMRHHLKTAVRGLEYIHSRGFVHCDVKPSNFLLFRISRATCILKMIDFECCHRVGELIHSHECAPGTPMFASPEVIYHNLFHEESVAVDPTWDLFSFGCMAYFALTGSPFYIDAARILGKTLSKDASMKEVSSITLHARYNPLDVLASAVESEHLTTQDASMLKKILVERVSIDELLRHPFFGVEFSETEFRQLSLDAQHGRNVEQSLRDIRRDMKDMKQSMDEFVAAGSSLPLSNATRVESDAYDAIKKDETLRDYCNVLCRTLNQTYVGCLAAESGQLKRTSHRDSLLSFASHTPLIGKIFEFLNKIVTSVRSISQKNASARFVELATGVADMENSVKRASLLITRAKEHQIHGVEDVCGRLAQFFDSLREKVFYNSINTPAKKMAVKDAMLIIRAAMEGSISVHNDIADQMVDIVVRESDSAFERDDSGDQSPSNGSSTLSSSRGCIIQ